MNIIQNIKEFFLGLPVISMFARYEPNSVFEEEAKAEGLSGKFEIFYDQPTQTNLESEGYTVITKPVSDNDDYISFSER